MCGIAGQIGRTGRSPEVCEAMRRSCPSWDTSLGPVLTPRCCSGPMRNGKETAFPASRYFYLCSFGEESPPGPDGAETLFLGRTGGGLFALEIKTLLLQGPTGVKIPRHYSAPGSLIIFRSRQSREAADNPGQECAGSAGSHPPRPRSSPGGSDRRSRPWDPPAGFPRRGLPPPEG